MGFIYQIFGKVLWFCNEITNNYLFAIILFAIFAKILLFPLGIKQQKSQRRQAEIYPKEAAIRKKYAGRDDPDSRNKLNQEIMDLYQREKYSPYSGCLPLLVQFPFIIILYNVIRNPLSYISNYSKETISAVKGAVILCKDELVGISQSLGATIEKGASALSELHLTNILGNAENFEIIKGTLSSLEEPITLGAIPNFKAFGMNLAETPDIAVFNLLLLIPVLTFILQFASMKLTRKFSYVQANTMTREQKMSSGIMDIMMPLMTVWMTFMFPAALGIYWMFQTVLGVVQQIILKAMYPAPKFTERDFKEAEREIMRGKPSRGSQQDRTIPGKTYRSLHHIDDDDGEYAEFTVKPEDSAKKNDGAPPLKDESDRHTKK